MNEHETIDALAAEYVLGTLEEEERIAVSGRRLREWALDDAIVDWEQRLAPLMWAIPELKPRSDLFAEIETRLAIRRSVNSRLIDLEQHARRWRRTALAATAVAAALLVVIGVRETMRPQLDMSYVAVLQKDDSSPAFLLAVDLDKRSVSIRPVAAQAQPGKTYQLWIASDKLGAAPQSLGLIADLSKVTRHALASYSPAIVEKATFGISLEPEGGSPTGLPTGPALHAKLIPAPR